MSQLITNIMIKSLTNVIYMGMGVKMEIFPENLNPKFFSCGSRACLAVRFLRYELEREWSKLRLEWKSKFQKV